MSKIKLTFGFPKKWLVTDKIEKIEIHNMKKLLILLLTVPLLSLTVEKDNTKFIGKWAGEDEEEIAYLNFNSDGFASFEIGGQIMGGKEFVLNGKKGSMTYEINSKTNPIQVDLIVTMTENQEQKKMLCIADFIDNDTMKFAIGFDENRPNEFDSENSLVFRREK